MMESAFQVETNEGKSRVSYPGDPSKELGLQEVDSLTSIDIQEMERVRLSLQNMLKSSEHFLRDDNKDLRNKEPTDQEAFNASIGTSVLLNNYVNADKQEVAMVVNETSFDENSDTIMRRSRTNNYDKSLVLENSILNESLEKERFKRRHCEQHIKDLQSKLLETQQQLAVSVSGERKKDVMINQLDKTLARVVEDWKKHEQGKFDALSKLEDRREQDEHSQRRQQEMLGQFEKDLSQAVEALSKEQERAANAEHGKDSQIAAVLGERNQLLQLLQKESEKAASYEKEIQALGQIANKTEELERLLDKENHDWQEERSELESKIELITQAHVQDLQSERKLVDHERQVAEDSQRVLAAVQKEVQHLTVQLDTSNREKENLKTEMTLVTAKFEAQKSRQDNEHRAELERQLSKNLRDVQNQLNRNENETRTANRKQIEDLTEKYKNDLEEQLRKFHQQLKGRDKKLKETNEDYEEKLSKAHEQLVNISSQREALKNEKHKMVVRLQKMMQSHCEEALSLLVANTLNFGGENVLIDQHRNASWITRQTPTLITSAANVGDPREPPAHGTPLFPHHAHVSVGRKPSDAGDTNQHLQARYSNQSRVHTQAPPRSADEDPEYTWRKLSPMVSEHQRTARVISNHLHKNSGHAEHSYPPNNGPHEVMGEQTLSDHSSPRDESNVEHPRQSPVRNTVQHESDDEKGPYTELSPSTTNESLAEQTTEEDHEESRKPDLPLNLNSDVLKMLHQQQSRQTELNHYVRQLLKKSPSNGSGTELPDLAPLSMTSLSVVRNDDPKPVISPIKEHGLEKDRTVRFSNVKNSPNADDPSLVYGSTVSEQVNTKQTAFRKSAATPRKGFNSSKIPVPQSPPNNDYSDITSGNSVLTPEQVGQLARLIQMYQKDNEDENLPSPEKMFQYLRDVQTRGEMEVRRQDVDKHESFDPAVFSSKQVKKDNKAKRKLEVNIPPNKSKEVNLVTDPGKSGHLQVRKSVTYDDDDQRRLVRASLSSESVLTVSRKPETRSKSTKQPKRATNGKSAKAWK